MATQVSNGIGARIRKVTITEINDNEEWNWPNPGCIEESEDEVEDIVMKSTDEIFDDLEAVVQGWKKNLELIVAEGLKTIKKTTKERKMMMKYLPGDGLIGGSNATLKARCQILADWQNDITSVITSTHKKLNKLGDDKIVDTNDAVKDFVSENVSNNDSGPPSTNPCTTVSLDFDTLMHDLDALYQKYSYINTMAKVPIYSVQKDLITAVSNSSLPWRKPITSSAKMFDQTQTVISGRGEARPQLLSLLHDFVSDQRSQNSIMEEWRNLEATKKKVQSMKREAREKKPARRGRDSVQKMKERKEIRKYKRFLLREIVKKGETHYYIIKKEVKEPLDLEAEDIFADWSHNLREIKRPRKLTPRTRKISNRAQRKEMLREALDSEEREQGPLTYSQMVRKNLKMKVEAGSEVEEMFGPWMKSVEKLYRPHKPTNAADEVEVFQDWNFIFEDRRVSFIPPPLEALECGKPTVIAMLSSKKVNKRQTIEKLSAKLQAEGYPLGKAGNMTAMDINKAVSVRSSTEVVPYVERKPLKLETIEKITPAARDFRPSCHSQRNLVVKDAKSGTFIGPINKPAIPTPPPMPSFNWTELLVPKIDTKTDPPKSYKTEEIFEQWRHIFIESNKTPSTLSPKLKRSVREYKEDNYFMEWLRNLEEPLNMVRNKSEKENKIPSPKSSKREEKKLVRKQFIDEDVTEVKDIRRNDFFMARKIKDKKRTKASRNSLGKKVK